MKVGIDLIHFATSDYYLGLDTFAAQKNQDVNKYYVGIGQEKMSIAPPDEDIVTLAAKAAAPILAQIDPQAISAVLFATESGVDQSKSAGTFLHGLLKLPHKCRTIELKQACYAGAAALQMAKAMILANPKEQILVIASDIARYELDSSGEATQGCGAVCMLIKTDPRIIELEAGSGYYMDDVMDFWRPNFRSTALVDGKFSTKVYLNSLKNAWQNFSQETGKQFSDIQQFCYHIPFTKMAEKAHKALTKLTKAEQQDGPLACETYNRVVGNSYCASLFIGLCSLLDHSKSLDKQRVGFFSYGSGSVAEYFSGIICPGYQAHLMTASHQAQINNRTQLDYPTYVAFQYQENDKLENITLAHHNHGNFRLCEIKNAIRIYHKIN